MFVRLLNISYFLSFYLVKPNIIQNGDFEAGEVDPWRCLASQCDASNRYLGKTFSAIGTMVNILLLNVKSCYGEERNVVWTKTDNKSKQFHPRTIDVSTELQFTSSGTMHGQCHSPRGSWRGGEVHVNME